MTWPFVLEEREDGQRYVVDLRDGHIFAEHGVAPSRTSAYAEEPSMKMVAVFFAGLLVGSFLGASSALSRSTCQEDRSSSR